MVYDAIDAEYGTNEQVTTKQQSQVATNESSAGSFDTGAP